MEAKIVQFDNANSPDIISIRTQVFVDEQSIDTKLDFDGLDQVAVHVLVSSKGCAVGTGRILNDGHIGRIAVLKNVRKQGVGVLVLNTLISEAKKKNHKRIYLGSQMHATEFYKRLGLEKCGEVFMDAELQHIEMELFLD